MLATFMQSASVATATAATAWAAMDRWRHKFYYITHDASIIGKVVFKQGVIQNRRRAYKKIPHRLQM